MSRINNLPLIALSVGRFFSRWKIDFEPFEFESPNIKMRNMNNAKPLASLSLDLDNKWSYMKTHGDAGWKTFPTYLDIFIPSLLIALERLELKITFFIVGQDAALDKNTAYLRLITEMGHEAGNHSFHHEPWLQLYSKERIKKEIMAAEEQIVRVTGQKPVGFRGPGFSWSPDLIEVLADNDYLYDASTLPTYLGPLARAYYFRTAKLTAAEKQQRRQLFGKFSDGWRPVKPYFWQLAEGKNLLEIPVTTMPVFKIPFHLSYLLYLSRVSDRLLSLYLQAALNLCRITNTEPSFLLHPLDLLGGDQEPELAFFPGMDLCSARKLELFERVIATLSQHFELVNMSAHAQAVCRRLQTKVRHLPAANRADQYQEDWRLSPATEAARNLAAAESVL
jgi:peptidoglycan/xylan/chitin deacetylase (PgdA/CDA1 family)